MTPFELNRQLREIDDRVRSAVTACASLVVFAVLVLAGGYGLHRLDLGTARTLAVTAASGALVAVGVGRLLAWHRSEVYETVIVSGFRHVRPQEVARRAAKLVMPAQRLQMATALERLVDSARGLRPSPVPVHCDALRACEQQIRSLARCLRQTDVELLPPGMVLLRRLVCDGATSPVFRPEATARDLERALDRITAALGLPGGGPHVLPLAA